MGNPMGHALNAIRPSGQTISIPKGKRLYFLAASSHGDRLAPFKVNGRIRTLKIQAWDGFIGQWDTRLWEGAQEDEKAFGWTHKLLGIAPGFIKRDPVAWYADHKRLADGVNDAYHFCYLFRYCLELPEGAKTVTLPFDRQIVILAATVADSAGEEVRPLRPLYDTLAGHPSYKTP